MPPDRQHSLMLMLIFGCEVFGPMDVTHFLKQGCSTPMCLYRSRNLHLSTEKLNRTKWVDCEADSSITSVTAIAFHLTP